MAASLLTPDATPTDRAIVEAMAERALAVVEPGSAVRMRFDVERAMVSAATRVIQQHHVRCLNLLSALASCDDDDAALPTPDVTQEDM